MIPRLYAALLRLYPSSFRNEYGPGMTDLFERACAEKGAVGRAFLLLGAAAEEVPNAVAVHWDVLVEDLRYAVRSLTRARAFATTAILVTALGVGANTAAFSVADFVLLRPLAFEDPEALVQVCEGPRVGGGWGCNNELSPANYRDLKAGASSFEAMGAFRSDAVNLVGSGEPRRLQIAPVTQEVLPLLGVEPALGRFFDAGDPARGAAILAHGLWRSQFGGDAGVLGKTVTLNGAPHTIVGVMPASFTFPNRETQMWTAWAFRDDDFANRNNTYIQAVARLKRGVSFEQARADLVLGAQRLSEQYPATNAETGISFFRTRDAMAPRVRLMLMALGGASLCLLLLTCANLANLLVARASSRERELAVRAALGAGRERLSRQLMTETLALTLTGGAFGVLIAAFAIPLFSNLVPASMAVAGRPALDLRVLAWAGAFTALTGLGFAVLPAIRASRDLGFEALREGRGVAGGPKARLRSALVSVEVAMSVVLLITAGLLIRAVARVQDVEPGFDPRGVLTLRTALPRPKYDAPALRNQFFDRVLAQVRALPGVESAAFTTGLPMVMTGGITGVEVPGREVRSGRGEGVSYRFVTPHLFKTMGIPLLRGRDVEQGDSAEAPWVAVVSASFAERYWPGADPIGKTFLHRTLPRTIVGVVGDVRVRGLERTSEPQMYLPAAQVAENYVSSFYDPKELVVRHAGPADQLVPAVRDIVHAVDPEQPVSDVRTMESVRSGDTAARRGQIVVLTALAAVAFLLSGVGVYGLLAYTVEQRSLEIGVRLALGAEPWSVARMIVSDGFNLAIVGLVPGALAALAAGQSLQSLLFGIGPADPLTFATAIALALAMTFAACVAPALRAFRASPLSSLGSR